MRAPWDELSRKRRHKLEPLTEIRQKFRSVNFYKKGCPKGDDITDPGVELVGSSAGQPGQEIWCYRVDSAHTAYMEGIEADGMKVDVFADWQCQNLIET
jgi:hypothetical protein